MRTRFAMVLLLVSTSATSACEIVAMVSGDTKLAQVSNDVGAEVYPTYLIRNNARNSEGILVETIRGELIPERWGYDVKLPNGKRVGLIGFEGRTAVLDDITEDRGCQPYKLTLVAVGDSTVVVLNHGNHIGTISRFPRNLLQQ
jgi:hypothetical protein